MTDLRRQFPILQQRVYGHPLVYLDSAATAQKPTAVLDRCRQVYQELNSNIHRGVHHLSNVCTELYEQARTTLAEHLNASPNEIVFTRNTTEAINLVAQTYGARHVGPGDQVIITHAEHHSNLVPWQMLCQRSGATLAVAPINDNGDLDYHALAALLTPSTRIVALAHVGNVTGAVNDVERVARLAHQAGAVCLVDAAQSFPHHPLDVRQLGCDFLALSGHKAYGPLGSGALYGRAELLDDMPPWQGGGEMIDHVSLQGTTYAPPPLRFEAGTPDYVAAIGLATAVEWLDQIGLEQLERHEDELLQHLVSGLDDLGGITLVGRPQRRSGVVSFLLDGAHPYDVGALLDKQGIAVRTGHHCAQPLMQRLGIPGTVRASVAAYNNHDDIDQLLDALRRCKQILLHHN